jgi:hypothetical protein
MLHFFWKMGVVGFVRGYNKIVNIRILAIPISFVSPITFNNSQLKISSFIMKSE